MATLKDIALRTGLSINTVSLALRGSPRISDATRLKVEAAARAVDYTPNHAAKSLVSRRTMTIGLLLTDITSPLLTQVARAVELALKESGYMALLAASNGDPAEEVRALATFRARQVDGVLAYPHDVTELDAILRLRETGMPTVLLAGPHEAVPADIVSTDEVHGGHVAAARLLAAGHRRLGVISGTRPRTALKQRGILAALAGAGLSAGAMVVEDPRGDTPRHGHDAAARLMTGAEPPTAIIASNDRLAFGALAWCRQNGRAVPQDVAVIGFDNVDLAAYAVPPLTSVDYPVEAVTRAAIERLMVLIAAPTQPAPTALRIRPDLILRGSFPG